MLLVSRTDKELPMNHTCETVHDGNLCIYCGEFVEQSNSKSEDTSLDDTNKALEQAFKDYRIKCDMALSERDDGVYTQAEYEEAIMWNLDNAISFVHEIYSSRIAKLLQVIEDEAVKANRMSYQPNNWDNTKTWPIIHQPCLIIPEETFKQLKDNVINGGSL